MILECSVQEHEPIVSPGPREARSAPDERRLRAGFLWRAAGTGLTRPHHGFASQVSSL